MHVLLPRLMLGKEIVLKIFPGTLATLFRGNVIGRSASVRYIRMTREEVLHIRMDPPFDSSSDETSRVLSLGEIASSTVSENVENDALYKSVSLELKGHDRAVLRSYEMFALAAADHLGIAIDGAGELDPPYVLWRRTLLKSAHVHKSARVQYETRTYRRRIRIVHMTGSTADTFLEYVERNLPEGVGMQVVKQEIIPLTSHMQTMFKKSDRLCSIEGEEMSPLSRSSYKDGK
uniref:Small ribosomal subunit protein uS10m n=1 Tax=Trichuris muris TaxID=70415 RepID=A0A5S6QQY5_TRIMR